MHLSVVTCIVTADFILGQSEELRNILRRKDQEIKDHQDVAALQSIENSKWFKEHDAYEERVGFLEAELAVAQQAQASLDEQKQENLMLKETIDRMRFDMDELRNGLTNNAANNAASSAPNSVSKSLGAELLSKMRNDGGWLDDDDDDEEANTSLNSLDIGVEDHDDDTEGEDVIQTIITRKKRVCVLSYSS